MTKLEEAECLAESGHFEEALRKINEVLDGDFDNPKALFIAGFLFLKMDRPGLAYQVIKRSSDLAPHVAASWGNMGKCYLDTRQQKEAEACFRRQLKLDPKSVMALNNLGLINQQNAEYGLAMDYFRRVLNLDPEQLDAQINVGFSNLGLYKWEEGWKGYNKNIGYIADRKELLYRGEPRWDGSKGKKVLVYGEQGIGDEISFASCIPDLIRDSEKVVIDCDKRLIDVFGRSFDAKVYGDRYKEEKQGWHDTEEFDYRVPVGQLPQFYRNKDEDFPGTPYLIPNKEKAIQWRALLDSLGDKPKIGIAWTGGRPHTYRSRRSLSLDSILPLLKFDADWISLQYKDPEEIEPFCEKNGVKIHHWPWGVECYDYDQTISLISELDLVISVTTTVVHAAGAIGKECWCLVPEKAMWRYGTKGSKFHWADSVTLFRQKGKDWPVYELLGKLREKFDSR